MRLYNLKHGQSVEIEDKLLVALENSEYRINGKVVELTGGRWQEPGEYMFEPDTLIEKVVKHGNEVYYKNGDIVLTSKEYKTQLDAIDSKYRDENYTYFYPDLETEYEVKKQVQDFVNSYERFEIEQDDTYETVDIEIIAKTVDTGSRFIQTPLQLGSVSFNGYGFFKVRLSEIAKDEWDKMVAKYSGDHVLTNSNHSNIQYAQFDRKYIYSDGTYRGIKENQYHIVNTLEEARQLETEMRQIVRKPILQLINKDKQITVDKAFNILSTLKSIKTSASKVESKVKTQDELRQTFKMLNGLIKELEDYLAEEN